MGLIGKPHILSVIEKEKRMKKRLWKLAAGICLVLAMQLILVSCSSSPSSPSETGEEDIDRDDDSSYTSAEAPQILSGGNFYYRSVDSEPEISLNFGDGYVTIMHDDTGNLSGRDYELNDGFISVTLEEGDEEDGDFAYIAPLQDIQILDLCTLMDMNGSIYALDDSQGTELGTGRAYYQNADVDADSYLFRGSGVCDFYSEGNDVQLADYAVDGETITVTLDDGDTRTLYLINGRLLESDDGEIFVRL
jgi:hypothetical protein